MNSIYIEFCSDVKHFFEKLPDGRMSNSKWQSLNEFLDSLEGHENVHMPPRKLIKTIFEENNNLNYYEFLKNLSKHDDFVASIGKLPTTSFVEKKAFSMKQHHLTSVKSSNEIKKEEPALPVLPTVIIEKAPTPANKRGDSFFFQDAKPILYREKNMYKESSSESSTDSDDT
jgi:hypothetical protein